MLRMNNLLHNSTALQSAAVFDQVYYDVRGIWCSGYVHVVAVLLLDLAKAQTSFQAIVEALVER
jgi:hypothetical protein